MCDLGTIAPKNVFYKDTEQNGPLLLKGEPIVPTSEFRAEQFSSLCAIWELLLLKMCSF